MFNRFFLLTIVFVFCFFPRVFADTVILKSGQKLEGKILEHASKYITMDPGVGMVLTYYNDEIESINGQALQISVPVTAPVKTSSQETTQPQDPFQSKPVHSVDEIHEAIASENDNLSHA